MLQHLLYMSVKCSFLSIFCSIQVFCSVYSVQYITLFPYVILFFAMLDLHWCVGFSLLAASEGCRLVVVGGGVVSHCGGFSLQSTGSRVLQYSCNTWAQQLQTLGLKSKGSVTGMYRLSCSTTCGIFLIRDQTLACLLH